MMIPIQKNVLVNTDKISIVQLREVSGTIRVEVVVDGRSFLVEDNMMNDEFRNFLRGEFDSNKITKQYTSV